MKRIITTLSLLLVSSCALARHCDCPGPVQTTYTEDPAPVCRELVPVERCPEAEMVCHRSWSCPTGSQEVR